MVVQAVVKSVTQGVGSERRSELYEATATGGERKVGSAPVSSDQMGGTTVVIPATVTIDLADGPTQVVSCVLTDDEGNIFTDAYLQTLWTSADEDIATVNDNGVITPVAEGGPINITASAMGVTDTIAVTITDV